MAIGSYIGAACYFFLLLAIITNDEFLDANYENASTKYGYEGTKEDYQSKFLIWNVLIFIVLSVIPSAFFLKW